MMAISLRSAIEDRRALLTPLSRYGVVDLDQTLLIDLIGRLGLGSAEAENRSKVSPPPTSEVFSLERSFAKLKNEKQITETIGPAKFKGHVPIYFATLLSVSPKPYIQAYQEVANELIQREGCVYSVWLEDSFSRLYRGWDEDTTQTAISAYERYLRSMSDKTEILVSSGSGMPGVPQEFLESRLSGFTLGEFKELLPFHQRNPELITALDVVHFCWNCYVVTKLPGIHLVGANTKRHYQLFRKLSDGRVTVVLIPQIPT